MLKKCLLDFANYHKKVAVYLLDTLKRIQGYNFCHNGKNFILKRYLRGKVYVNVEDLGTRNCCKQSLDLSYLKSNDHLSWVQISLPQVEKLFILDY